MSHLFEPVTLNAHLHLNNRVVMAPMTRSMADSELNPTEPMAAYYGRRADAGLIITEAILVAKDGQGYPNSPGLYNDAQVAGWKQVTRRVHNNGGKIFAQLWHTGRLSHPIYRGGQQPIAPSAIGWHGRLPQTEGLQYGTPRAMTQADIDQVIDQFAATVSNAMRAGFDGVELHGANGYLIDQFLHWSSNQRTDEYGGTPENMCRFLLQVLAAVTQVVPAERVGVRLSPYTGQDEPWIVMEHDDRDRQVFEYLLRQLNAYNLAYVHKGMYDDKYMAHLDATPSQFIRRHYRGKVIACGGYDVSSGAAAIARGDADLIAFGRPFIANPDLVHRFRSEQPLREYEVSQLATLD